MRPHTNTHTYHSDHRECSALWSVFAINRLDICAALCIGCSDHSNYAQTSGRTWTIIYNACCVVLDETSLTSSLALDNDGGGAECEKHRCSFRKRTTNRDAAPSMGALIRTVALIGWKLDIDHATMWMDKWRLGSERGVGAGYMVSTGGIQVENYTVECGAI